MTEMSSVEFLKISDVNGRWRLTTFSNKFGRHNYFYEIYYPKGKLNKSELEKLFEGELNEQSTQKAKSLYELTNYKRGLRQIYCKIDQNYYHDPQFENNPYLEPDEELPENYSVFGRPSEPEDWIESEICFNYHESNFTLSDFFRRAKIDDGYEVTFRVILDKNGKRLSKEQILALPRGKRAFLPWKSPFEK